MRKYVLLAYGLLVLLGFLITVQGLQMNRSITSNGTIDYSMRDIVIKRYTSPHFFNDTEAETIATLFDMCQASRWVAEKIRQVHGIRPDFKALLYRNLRAIYNYSGEWQMALDNNWILKDENGQLVYVTVYPTNYLVDIGNPQYQKWVVNWIKENINQYGFDGVMTDFSLHAWASEHFWNASASPINPRTGKSWKDEEIRQALIEVHKEIKNAISSNLLVCNGIFQGQRFWRRYDEYMEILSNSPLDGLVSEGLWYQYKGTWMSEEEWLDSLNMLVWFQDNFLKEKPERIFVPGCKLESTVGDPYPLPPNCSKEQMATYAFASTLLGAKNNQNYLALIADVNFTISIVQPLYNVDVGAPLSDYYIIADTHVYARDFSNVKVLVNPTSDSYVIGLRGMFKTIDGELVSEIVMERHTGVILIRVH